MQHDSKVKLTVALNMWKESLVNVNNWPSADQLFGFWMHLQGELSIRNLLYYEGATCHCWIEQLLNLNNISSSTLVLDRETDAQNLRLQHNVEMLGLICLDELQYDQALSTLSLIFNQMRDVPLLIQMCLKDRAPLDLNELAAQVLKRCRKLLMPNVLVFFGNIFKSDQLFGYQYFPEFRLIEQIYSSNLKLFPYKLGNLYGHVLRTQPDLSQPYTLMYKDEHGNNIITGGLWRLMEEFARQLNATLELSFKPTASKSFANGYFKLMDLTQNRTLDISCSLFPLLFWTSNNLHLFSYPVYMSSWCTMLPVERVVSASDAMSGVLEPPWMWLCLGFIYFLFRWLHRRHASGATWLALIAPLIKLTLMCSVLAQLSALFICPQKLHSISNLEQLSASGLKIIGLRSEFKHYPDEMRIKYASSFISLENYTAFIIQRNSFNASFGYTVFSLKWRIYAELQRYFKRPLFRYSTDLCIREASPQSLLVQENSLYRHQLNQHVLWLRQSGLLMFWNDNTFYDLISAGHFSLKDLSQVFRVEPLDWTDWSFIAMLYAYAIAASSLVFLFELLVGYCNVCLDLI